MGDDERTIHDIRDEIQAKQQRISELQQQLLEGQMEPQEYEEQYEQILEEIHELEEEAKTKGF